MEPAYADATCVLKVQVHCHACKMRMMEVLGSICGMYNVDINAESELAIVYAEVDPSLLLRALARTGYHAEVKWVNIQHPRMGGSYFNSGYGHKYGALDSPYNYGYGHKYGALDYNSYGYRGASSNYSWYDGHLTHYGSPRSSDSLHYHGSGPHSHGLAMPLTRFGHARKRRPFGF